MKVREEGKEAGAWTKFKLLMWKNFLQQWRHRVQTFVELLLPVLTLSLVLLLRSNIEPAVMEPHRYPPISAHSLNFSLAVLGGMNVTRMSIAYSPECEVLDDVVRTAVARLVLRNIRDFVSIVFPDQDIELPPNLMNDTFVLELSKRLINVTPYKNSTALRSIYIQEEATRRVITAVEFSDDLYGAQSLPLNVSYALRFPERPRLNSFYQRGGQSWRTDRLFPVFELPGPRFPWSFEGGNDPGYVNEMFIALQHVLSSELVSRVTGQDLFDFPVHIQRYPHPEYVSDLAVQALQFLFPMFIMLSFSYSAVNIVRAITVEKEMQLKETMKIMGLPTWLHWMAWFWKQFIYLSIAAVLITVILKVNWFTTEDGFSEFAVFTHTPWTVLLFYILLYLICTIFFCFMLSSFFSKASTAALFGGVIWFMSYVPASLLSMDVNMSQAVQMFTCLSLNSAMSYGFQVMIAAESTGGISWGGFWSSPTTEDSRFLFGHVVVMLVVDCVLYMLVALYMEQVLPGPYGTPKPWYFFLQRQVWCPNRFKPGVDKNESVFENHDEITVKKENDPTDLNVGVQISNLTKVYGSNVVVNGLSLNIYDDQITVLLGHNGAGKSTTISMLTGNLEITRGSVTVAGYDITKQTRLARGHIGLCPQHNVIFNELTVREHLEFFARLKGFTGNELFEEIDALIEKLELGEKRNYEARGLSGGQKRRLCVGIALSGAARVVLLDEPTSGMDPASRRALWDLLQREKKGRSMILTTHFMDEADYLGDRVAIMAQGRLQCVGSPYFLKRHYGVGYTLVVVKKKGFQLETCTNLISRFIPDTILKEDRGTEATYRLSIEYSHIFEQMLLELEAKMDEIKFKSYGLLATTMEDVFMSAGADVGAVDLDETATVSGSSCDDTLAYELDTSLEQLAESDKELSGWRAVWQHTLAIWLKLALVWSRSWPLLALQVAGLLTLMVATLGVMTYVLSFTDFIQRRELTLTQGFSTTETLLNFNGSSSSSVGHRAKQAYESIFMEADLPTMQLTVTNESLLENYYLERTKDNQDMTMLRHHLLIGATFNDTAAVAWFSNFGYHDVANSLAAVHRALLKAFRPDADITVYNHPLEAQYANQGNMEMMVQMLSMQMASGVGTSLGLVLAVFIMFYIKERVSRAKLLQKAAGIQPAVMWGAAAVFDWAWFCILCLLVLITCVIFNVIGVSTPAELGRLYLAMMVCGAAMMPLNYVCSYLFKGPAVGFVTMFFVNVLLGMMGAQIVEALSQPFLTTQHVATVLDYIFQFFPLYSLVTVVRILNTHGLVEWSCMQGCEYMSVVMPNITECTMEEMCKHFSEQCCVRENTWWEWEDPGMMRYITSMLVTCVIMWLILMIVEYRVLQKVFNREKKPPPIDESTLDSDVVDEARHVERIDRGHKDGVSLVAKGLTKYYGKHLAVDQVSFTVGDKECFGLLGVNGAGKTTTFKMLMGDELVSSGDAFVRGHSVKTDITAVHKNIGYCPQFDAIFNELTGRETLKLFAMLRGLRPQHAAAQTEALAYSLGFTKHLDKKVEQYSGGNKRKLSTAVSLLGRTRLVFVDEPTTGVDPAAKRQVWQSLRAVCRGGRGVVLTSHSMEECEALCSRLTIMVNGRFQCLGTPQHLKHKFSEGFTLIIKMKVDDATNTVSTDMVNAIKTYINSNFKQPRIMEEHQGLLTYYLPDRTMPWSRMFGVMERAKQLLEVETYSISQTTLEQIFLQFTKYQREQR